MKSLTIRGRVTVIGIYLITALSIFLITQVTDFRLSSVNGMEIVFFILITALTESITVQYKNAMYSTTFAITIATYILLGPIWAGIILVLGFMMRVLKIDHDVYEHIFNTPFYGTVFNCCGLVFPLLVGHLFYVLAGGGFARYGLKLEVFPVIVFSITYALANHLILTLLTSAMIKKNWLYCVWEHLFINILNHLVMVPFAIVLLGIYEQYHYWGIVTVLFPILTVRYTFLLYTEHRHQLVRTADALMNAVEARDTYTRGHSRRVADIAYILAEYMGYNQWKIDRLYMAATLHDIGKIGVGDMILNKPGKLTEEEYRIITSHPTIGDGILNDVRGMDYVRMVIKHHHERYDGGGYPDGTKGNELSLDIYIIQLADTVDAMASDRPYRKGLPMETIVAEIERFAGTQFHPKVAETFIYIATSTNALAGVWEEK